jgi:type I restriction enzyme R subunit
MADIISMVKHAASEENPLLTAQERVDRAIKRITEGREFTEEQLKWLNLIKAHLEINLAIDREDFDEIPAFTRKGGWKVANKVFDNLEELLKEINEAVAA